MLYDYPIVSATIKLRFRITVHSEIMDLCYLANLGDWLLDLPC